MNNEGGIESPDFLCASYVFSDALEAQVNQNDVDSIIQAQKRMMSRFEKCNEMLINCNALSTVRCHLASQEFKRHTHLLLEMKKDLDSIFKRIRVLKTKLSEQYSDSFQAVAHDVSTLDEESTEEPCCSKDIDVPSISVATQAQDGKHDSSSYSQTTTPSPGVSWSSTDST
ncbi:hypothetical protein CHUAL_011025 [Chamberlinius hualienensis]